jgi:YihY family inner membrane protein
VTTARAVPTTRDEELEGDDAFETLRAAGRRRLLVDAVARFRAADGTSHSRALAFQMTLALLPALIAVVGLAAALDQEAFRRTAQELIESVAPSAVADILTAALRQGTASARQETGETAVVAGFVAAVVAGTGAMSQVERGANRIYGVERDRPFVPKYAVALGLALTAGVLGLLSVVVLVGGAAVRDAIGFSAEIDAVWRVARWPLGLVLVVASVSLLLEVAPRRRQPEASWLAVGAAVAATLWLVFMGLLVAYFELTGSFGATYGPLAGTIGLLLWSFLTSVALFFGVALAAQLEAVRAGVPEPRIERDENVDAGEPARARA